MKQLIYLGAIWVHVYPKWPYCRVFWDKHGTNPLELESETYPSPTGHNILIIQLSLYAKDESRMDIYIYISSFIWLVMFISRIEMSECSWSLAASPARFLIKGQRPRAVWENGTGPGDWDTVYKQRPIGCLTQKKILINRSKSMWCISIIHHHSISGFLGRTR